jgi:hypothetical protein
MPFRVKFPLTVLVALVAIAGWFYMGSLGQVGPQWAVAFLGPFMVVALWIFPEVARDPADVKAQKPAR